MISLLLRQASWLRRNGSEFLLAILVLLSPAAVAAPVGLHLTQSDTDDRTRAVVYAPTSRAFTFDLTRLKGPCGARWCDPTSGEFKSLEGSPFANAGEQEFSPPTTKAAVEKRLDPVSDVSKERLAMI
jgi:hypothetical protein